MIYLQSILASRWPTPENIYQRNLRAVWEDLPSPLLRVSQQIRAEDFDILQTGPFTMRITSYGANFDMFGLSCFIAQQRPKSYSGLRELAIEIWPPHPDRPSDMYYNNCHLQKLRDEVRAASGMEKIVICFKETKFAK